VQALIAGRSQSSHRSGGRGRRLSANAARDLRAIKLTKKDIVAGICASGTTPYVLGALRYASQIHADTIAITVNRNTPVARLAEF